MPLSFHHYFPVGILITEFFFLFSFFFCSTLLTYVHAVDSCLVAMLPRVNLIVHQAIKAAAAARATERKKKRPAVQAGQYELKRIRNGPRVDPAVGEAAQQKVTTMLTGSQGAILIRIPLVEVLRGSTPRLED